MANMHRKRRLTRACASRCVNGDFSGAMLLPILGLLSAAQLPVYHDNSYYSFEYDYVQCAGCLAR